jgi:uncharacterized protein YqhQ
MSDGVAGDIGPLGIRASLNGPVSRHPAGSLTAAPAAGPSASAPTAPPVGASSEASRPGPLTATRDAPVGGQAVLEGVMMRGVSHWAVAVRKPAAQDGALGEIGVHPFTIEPIARKRRIYRLPLIRGVVALGESMTIGMRALGISANAQMVDPEAVESEDGEESKEIGGGVWAGTVFVSMIFAIGLFFVVPVSLTSLIKGQLGSSVLFWLVEGLLRTGIFLGYLLLLSKIRDLRRVFEYHGAEHKVISCYEAEDELTPERATLYSRLHPRCGTSFLLVVMIVAIFVFAPLGLPAWWILVVTRILGVPVIAGLSFEIIKWAGRNRRRRWVQAIMYPGLQLQRLTTSEPDLEQLAVAIAALNAVLAVETPGQDSDDLIGVEVVA